MNVLFFNHSFFNISETFIYKQVAGLPADLQPVLLGFHIMNEEVFPLRADKIQLARFQNTGDKILTTLRRKLTGRAWSLSLMNGKTIKRYLRGKHIGLVHAHFGFNALTVLPLAKALNIPMVVTFHGIDASPAYLEKPGYRKQLEALFAYCKAIIVVSPHMIDTLQLSRWNEKTHVIPCGVDPSEFDGKLEKKDNIIRVLHSGRLVSKKGVPDLIKTFGNLASRFPNVQLDIIGDGPELAACKALAPNSSIHFHGAKPHEEVKQMMRQADIFVLNSRVGENGDMEGVPVSLLEAMSMKLPVLSTRHAGIPYVITDGVDGLLVPERDNDALEKALERLIIDTQLRQRLGDAARHTIEERFTLEKLNSQIYHTYKAGS